MSANEYRKKAANELQTELNDLLSEQFKLRMQKSTGQLQQSHLLRRVRRNIATVKTIIVEKVRAGEAK